MKSATEFHHFATNLSALGVGETVKAIGCLWFADDSKPGTEMTVKEVAECMQFVGLAKAVNITRLAHNLQASGDVVRGTSPGTFRVSPTRKGELSEKFGPCLKNPAPKVSDVILPVEIIQGTKAYLEKIAYQINGCYECTFYDGCAVLCRRIVESLLVGAFDKAGHLEAIQNPSDGNLMMLDGIIRQAKGGKYIRLPRGAADVIEKIKTIGDTAAHDRYHLTTKQDIDDFRTDFRRVISQLLALGGISASGSV